MVFGAMALAAVTAAPSPASSRWERMGEIERGSTLIVAGVMLTLLAFLVARQLLRRKTPPRDPAAFPVFSGCEGHRMTAVWRRRSKVDEHGRYVVFRDWTTGANIDHPAVSPHIHHSDAPIFSFLPVLVLRWIVGMTTDWPSFLDGVVRYLLLAVAFGVAWFAIQFVVGTIDRGRSDEQLAQAVLVIGAEDASPQDPRAVP